LGGGSFLVAANPGDELSLELEGPGDVAWTDMGTGACGYPNAAFSDEDWVSFDGVTIAPVTASLTLYVQQPVPGTRTAYVLPDNVGHTSWTLSLSPANILSGLGVSGSLQRLAGQALGGTCGFIPTHNWTPIPCFNEIGPGVVNLRDSPSPNVCKTFPITVNSLISGLGLINGYFNHDYDLQNFNCTTFAIYLAQSCGVYVKPTVGTWANCDKGFDPGDLGQDLGGPTASPCN
jgi:hypothetical protein